MQHKNQNTTKSKQNTMSSLSEENKPHVVLVPYPAQGHINPFMQLAKILHSKGFHITFVNTEFNHRRLIKNNGPDSVKGQHGFCFVTIPDGLPPSDKDATQDLPSLCVSIKKNCLAPFVELVKGLNSSNEGPNVTCIISDGFMSFGIKAAKILQIPSVHLWTASACGFMGYLQYSELVKRGIVPFKDESFLKDGTLDQEIDWIPGMPNIRFRDLPSFIRVTDTNDIFFEYSRSETEFCFNSSSPMIMNTFDELEHGVLEPIKSNRDNIYTNGPLSLLDRQITSADMTSFRLSLWKEDTKCLEWLDKQKPGSVVYINYGSITVMTDKMLIEFAWGLAKSNHPFLWIVRPDAVIGDSATLPSEFYDHVKDRGIMASWCPQTQVLEHVSVGAFLTHCGWNSTLESLSCSVPVICWPFFAEQQTNCWSACSVWDIGVEVDQDVKRDDIEKLVKEMMEGEKGMKMRKRAKEWKEKAIAATDVGGSSYSNFDRFINKVLLGN